MNSVVMIKPDIQEKFDNFMQSGRIALFCAPCGFGKTTVVRELLKTKKTYEISADARIAARLAHTFSVFGAYADV